jgi:hypothetical protein
MITVAAILCLASFAWVLARIWRSSALLALASLFLWPVVLLALVRTWGDAERDIRIPVAAFGFTLGCSIWVIEAQRYVG